MELAKPSAQRLNEVTEGTLGATRDRLTNARAIPPLRAEGRSLQAVGVAGVDGNFAAGDVVHIA